MIYSFHHFYYWSKGGAETGMAYLAPGTDDAVHRGKIISNDRLIRKDYYTYCKIYSEYYTPMENYSYLYLRRFFIETGTVAYKGMWEICAYMLRGGIFRFFIKILGLNRKR